MALLLDFEIEPTASLVLTRQPFSGYEASGHVILTARFRATLDEAAKMAAYLDETYGSEDRPFVEPVRPRETCS